MASRRVRVFKRWMNSNSINYSDALQFTDDEAAGISVKTTRRLSEGELIATIPKKACLTVKTSKAEEMIESAGLGGLFGLSVAVMYERSLGSDSVWAGYLQLLGFSEDLPLVWSLDEIDSLLVGTELHKTEKEDIAAVHDDWKESILPLIHSEEFALDPKFFRVEDYFAAKSLVASRSFQIDDYYGDGMVPLADLFNHKTGAEDVHFTCVTSIDLDLGDSDEGMSDDENISGDELLTQTEENDSETNVGGNSSSDDANIGDELITQTEASDSETNAVGQISSDDSDLQSQDVADTPLVLGMILVNSVDAGDELITQSEDNDSETNVVDQSSSDDGNISGDELITRTSEIDENDSEIDVGGQSSSDDRDLQSEEADNPLILEMILVKDVEAGAEVFNTYGLMGNAALLHRYGFTEQDNPYDHVNIEMELVMKWSLTVISSRAFRGRLSLWKKLGHSGSISFCNDKAEYFEISHDGVPQLELLILLGIILLPEETYAKLDLAVAINQDLPDSTSPKFFHKTELPVFVPIEITNENSHTLLTKDVCMALLKLADLRESLYGTSSLEADEEKLRNCDCVTERKLYHSLVLRVSERRVIQKLRCYSENGGKSLGEGEPSSPVKKKQKKS